MNVNSIIVAKLNQKRSVLAESLAKLDELIAEFGGKPSARTNGKPGRKPGSKRTLSPEHIAKMQAARRAKKTPAPASAGETVNQGQGASLAAAAE